MEQIGVAHERLSVDVDEQPLAGESPEHYVVRVSLDKARAGRRLLSVDERRPVLGADTAVIMEDRILGKPTDRADGLSMLELLSGRTHRVLTAVALVGADGREQTRLSTSSVTFRRIKAEERQAYWATGEPMDKAGAYAIQGRGAIFIERLEGSYSGVMGLPVFETAELLSAFGYGVHTDWPRIVE